MLSQETLKHFKLFRNPFLDDVRSNEDVYLNQGSRFILAAMGDVAKNQGILAISGESGAGKTVLRKLFMEELRKDDDIAVIIPRIFDKSKITAASLCDAIVADVSSENPKRSMEAKARQVERLLRTATQGGRRHVLIIEDAHDLTVPILKYLKRFWEMEDGFNRLLGIILIGQNELKEKLDEKLNYEMREFIRRCIQVELAPLDSNLHDYLRFKFKRVGGDVSSILADDVIPTLVKKLIRHDRRKGSCSIAHPLAINGLLANAMNTAMELGESVVSADLIKEL